VPVLIDANSKQRAQDHLHPNDLGYEFTAADFTEAIIHRDSPRRN
jgi:hypothetical protein